jgi:hypothetical protein
VAVQVPALALMIGNPVARVEFEAAGDLHGRERLVCGKVFAPLRCAEASRIIAAVKRRTASADFHYSTLHTAHARPYAQH